MGWASASELVMSLWDEMREFIDESDRVHALAILIDKFTDHDWDSVDEIIDEWPEAREAILEYDPAYFIEEDE